MSSIWPTFYGAEWTNEEAAMVIAVQLQRLARGAKVKA